MVRSVVRSPRKLVFPMKTPRAPHSYALSRFIVKAYIPAPKTMFSVSSRFPATIGTYDRNVSVLLIISIENFSSNHLVKKVSPV